MAALPLVSNAHIVFEKVTPIGDLSGLRLQGTWKYLKHSTYKVDSVKLFMYSQPIVALHEVDIASKKNHAVANATEDRVDGKGLPRLPRSCKAAIVNVLKEKVSKVEAPKVVDKEFPQPLKKVAKRKRNGKKRVYKSAIQELWRCSACEKGFPSDALCNNHEEKCLQRIVDSSKGDIRNQANPEVKKSFMEQFGMIASKDLAVAKETLKRRIMTSGLVQSSAGRNTRAQNTAAAMYFRKHYFIPLVSARGQAVIKNSVNGVVANPTAAAKAVDTILAQKTEQDRRVSQRIKSSTHVTSDKKKDAKKVAYTHTYQFTRKQKMQRNTELIVGVKTRQFRLLNKCRGFSIKLPRIPDADVNILFAKKSRVESSLPKLVPDFDVKKSLAKPPRMEPDLPKYIPNAEIKKVVLRKPRGKPGLPNRYTVDFTTKVEIQLDNLADSERGQALLASANRRIEMRDKRLLRPRH